MRTFSLYLTSLCHLISPKLLYKFYQLQSRESLKIISIFLMTLAPFVLEKRYRNFRFYFLFKGLYGDLAKYY